MEDGARSALRELNLASRKAEEAGQSVFLSQFTFTFCVSFSLVAEKEKSWWIVKKVMESLNIFNASGCFWFFQEMRNQVGVFSFLGS